MKPFAPVTLSRHQPRADAVVAANATRRACAPGFFRPVTLDHTDVGAQGPGASSAYGRPAAPPEATRHA
eukprot:3192770-Pyramimonas_sp.AAC.1